MRPTRCIWRPAAFATIGAAVLVPEVRAQEGVAVEPAEVVSGMFYSGAMVRVSAVVPSGAAVAMVCKGEDRPLVLQRKGRALGAVWMNVGRVSFPSVPGLYLVRASAPLAGIASAGELERLGVGFGALAARCEPGSDAAALFGELVKLEERNRVWGVAEGAVEVQPAEEDVALATTDFRLPAKAKPGTYRILVYAFGDGHGALVGSAELRVEEGRAAALITSLAKRHGLLYGILAALVAMAAGLFTGLAFGLGSKHAG